ncbi:restriction endonuclease subunit S [Macrococcoides canis]|uniref:restriction endonuclease subunit S n=1 Tax=Macrococcoides canis TaxID=1855823 RepID=UPI001AEC0884|nr:restriction endonuclease subunit S [Macrococcus canis]QTQ07793.1 restriction endonuclease subunit S [Macrococcus canis]
MDEKKKNVPKRRFKEFKNADAWEQREFFENIERIIDFRGKTPKKLGLNWSNQGYLALSALNVKNGYIDLSVEANYGDESLYSKWMGSNKLEKGQVLFTTEAPMGNIARVPDNKGYILSQRTISFVTKQSKLIDEFLYILLGTQSVKTSLNSMSSGGTAKGISQRSLKNLYVTVPSSIEEQKKIGDTIILIEDTITLHQRKLEKYKTIKESYLEEMFPAEGQRKPRRRFPGFTDDWEQRELGSESKIIAGGDVDKYKLISFGKYPVLANALTNDGIVGYYNKDYRIEAPAITVTGRGDIGHAKARRVNFTPTVRLLALKTHHDIDFLEHSINLYRKVHESTGVPQLTTPQLAKYKLLIPKIEEQILIGLFLKKFDDTITLHQKKLDKLKKLKEALLEEMFV